MSLLLCEVCRYIVSSAAKFRVEVTHWAGKLSRYRMASSQCPPVETYQLTHKKILHFCRRRNWVSIYVKRDPRHNVDAVVAERTFFVPLCRFQLSPFRKEAIGLRPTSLAPAPSCHSHHRSPSGIHYASINWKTKKIKFFVRFNALAAIPWLHQCHTQFYGEEFPPTQKSDH